MEFNHGNVGPTGEAVWPISAGTLGLLYMDEESGPIKTHEHTRFPNNCI